MAGRTNLSQRDLEQLSAYLDGELSAREAARLESRLKEDSGLRRTFDELRLTSDIYGTLPQLRVPRNFTLSPEVAGVRAAEPRSAALPWLQWATGLATLAFAVVVGLDAMGGMRLAGPAAAPAMEPEALLAEEAMPAELAVEQEMAVPAAPEGTSALDEAAPAEPTEFAAAATEPAAEDRAGQAFAATPIPTPTPSPTLEPTPTAAPELLAAPPVAPLRVLEVVLGGLTLLLGGLTLWLRRRA